MMKKSNNKSAHNNDFKKTLEEKLVLLEDVGKIKSAILESSPGFLFNQTSVRIKIELLKKFRERGYDMTPEQGLVLNTVWEHEGIYQRELADLTLKDKPVITRILDGLEKKKLIYRQADSSDRRIFKIYLTPDGKNKIKSFSSIVAEIDEKTFRGLSAADMSKLGRILEAIRSNLGA
jgi:MarR family transcriptional regulator, transcriptional regulator for hemolysin